MTLRRKLLYLHSALAAFAIVAASATIYGAGLHVRSTITSFERHMDQSQLVELLRIEARARLVDLHDIVDGRQYVSESFLARKSAFFTRLHEVARFIAERRDESNWQGLWNLERRLKAEFERCIALVNNKQRSDARALLINEIERNLSVALDTRLRTIKKALDDVRRGLVNRVLVSGRAKPASSGRVKTGHWTKPLRGS